MKGLLTMLTLFSSAAIAHSEPFTIAERGKPRCVIATAQQQEHDALAKELAGWLQRVVGAERFSIQTLPTTQPAIILATAEQFPDVAQRERLAELGPEGYLIRSEAKRLWLLANTTLGLQHAMYRLLEETGCRWFFADPAWWVIPRKPTLRVNLNLREKPAFKDRVIWYNWGANTPTLAQNYQTWFKANRQGGHFPVRAGHAYEAYIYYSEFERHPEWFALVDGKRQPTQLCVSNPEVQQRVIDGVLARFAQNPQEVMASVEPNDGGGYCECDGCKAIGNASDQAFYLANLVAKAVRARYPDKWVGLLSYAYHSEPPRFRIEPGVYVQVTTGFRYTSLTFEQQVRRLRELGADVGVYDYFGVYPWDWSLPGAAKGGRFYEIASSIKEYHRLGLNTYSAESSINWASNGPGYWIAARLMWNPNLDATSLANEFYQKAFGAAARPMRRIYERWARGERFSPRGLKLALTDLQEAYRLAKDPQVRARLDQIAMYLHWQRLWMEYDRVARWDEGGKLVNDPAEVLARARDLTVYSRRVMDTGIVHSYPMLNDWFRPRFAALERIPGFSWQQTDAWKTERTDIPTPEEVQRDFADDLKRLDELVPVAVEIQGKQFTGNLVPAQERLSKAVQAWGEVPRSMLFVESGLHFFTGKREELLRLTFTPFDSGHTIDCRWSLQTEGGNPVAQGELKAEKGQPATLQATLPDDDVYVLDPGTDYWKAAQIEFDRRPLSAWAGRGNRREQKPLCLWMPRLDQPLYFYVPKGTRHFVIGIVSGGWPHTTLELRLANGTVIRREKLLAGDQVSVIVDQDIREYGDISEMGRQAVLPSQQLSVVVPKGADGQIWAIALDSLRCVLELYDVPPYVSRHPSELLVPENALR
jgi:hypothetical protein